jgi:hypothetical protein
MGIHRSATLRHSMHFRLLDLQSATRRRHGEQTRDSQDSLATNSSDNDIVFQSDLLTFNLRKGFAFALDVDARPARNDHAQTLMLDGVLHDLNILCMPFR